MSRYDVVTRVEKESEAEVPNAVAVQGTRQNVTPEDALPCTKFRPEDNRVVRAETGPLGSPPLLIPGAPTLKASANY